MAKRIWRALPGGRLKRWKSPGHKRRWGRRIGPPRWFRNAKFQHRMRRETVWAIRRGDFDSLPGKWSPRHGAVWEWW